jgi:predicted TIM-barrel enzyme
VLRDTIYQQQRRARGPLDQRHRLARQIHLPVGVSVLVCGEEEERIVKRNVALDQARARFIRENSHLVASCAAQPGTVGREPSWA